MGRPSPPCVAVLGLGEAGTAIAIDLRDAGAAGRAYDPVAGAPSGVTACPDPAAACTGADAVLSVNAARAALDVLDAGRAGAAPGTVWADLNTSAPELKRRLAAGCAGAGLSFADVALMAPVPGRGLATPALASGPGAARYAELLCPLGAVVEVLDGPPGLAATRKLLRSVFLKGLAAALIEALAAARAAGCEDWLRANIVAELSEADRRTVERLETGTHRHAGRRTDEVAAAIDLLTELGVPPRISTATHDWLAQLAGAQGSGVLARKVSDPIRIVSRAGQHGGIEET
jgi:3-hydroxyisobutyrate dehydrogenase-like beta-hydroxyacid dehydrogenase